MNIALNDIYNVKAFDGKKKTSLNKWGLMTSKECDSSNFNGGNDNLPPSNLTLRKVEVLYSMKTQDFGSEMHKAAQKSIDAAASQLQKAYSDGDFNYDLGVTLIFGDYDKGDIIISGITSAHSVKEVVDVIKDQTFTYDIINEANMPRVPSL